MQETELDLGRLLSRRTRLTSRIGTAFAMPTAAIALTYGYPDAESFPINDLIAATQRMLQREGKEALQYGNIHGAPALLDFLVEKARKDDGATLERRNVLITNGSSQAIDLACAAFLDPGDIVIVESPTFMGALKTFRIHEAELVGVPIDEDGVRVDLLADKLEELTAAGKRVKLMYTQPNFHNPAGVTMTTERRQALVELAGRYGAMIIEDDAYGDLRIDGEPLPSLFSRDRRGLVIKVGTFSKILSAGMRLGWLIGNAGVVDNLALLKLDTATSPFSTRVAAQFIQMGRLGPHIADLVEIYRRKRDTCLAALAEFCPPEVTWFKPAGGFYVWLQLPEQVDARRLEALALEEGVTFVPGNICFADGSGHNYIRLAYSLPGPGEITEGVRRLGRAIRRVG